MSNPAITSNPISSPRNDFGPYVGWWFTPAVTLYVKSLGRWKIAGNSQTHVIIIVAADQSTILASASLDLSLGANNSYVYDSLGSPLILSSGLNYYLMSQEFVSGDQWEDGQGYTFDSHIMPIGRVYGNLGAFNAGFGGAEAYVPSNMLFDLTAGASPLFRSANLNVGSGGPFFTNPLQ